MKYFCIVVGALLLLVGGYLLLVYYEDKSYKDRGNGLVEQVELFKKKNNRLPSSIADMGLEETMNDGPFYEKKSDTTYVVYFSVGFDDSFLYESTLKQWSRR